MVVVPRIQKTFRVFLELLQELPKRLELVQELQTAAAAAPTAAAVLEPHNSS